LTPRAGVGRHRLFAVSASLASLGALCALVPAAAQSAPGTPGPSFPPFPTPQVQGSPAAGSSVFHLVLDFGPWAGAYDAWTLSDACFETGQGFWSARFDDPTVVPSTITLIAARGVGSDPTVGGMSIVFGSLPGVTRYSSSSSAAITIDDAGNATVSDSGAHATLPDQPDVQGNLQASITCAGVVR
jgi:hypothetical protein